MSAEVDRATTQNLRENRGVASLVEKEVQQSEEYGHVREAIGALPV